MIGSISSQEPRIVLTWLIRLRWFAIAGQIAAILVAMATLGMKLQHVEIFFVVMVTAGTNLGMWVLLNSRREFLAGMVPGVLVLDVILLTEMLFWTGGADNPFCTLYVVHVAIAVVVLGSGWAWGIGSLSAICYATLFFLKVPWKFDAPPDPWVTAVGQWASLTLVSGIIAYFIGSVTDSIRERDRELSTMRARVIRNERIAGLTTLAAGAAHELGTPLATIAVVAKELELEARNTLPNSPMVDDAKLIRSEVDRCRAILDRMRIDDDAMRSQKKRRLLFEEFRAALMIEFKAEEIERLAIVPSDVATLFLPVQAITHALSVLVRNALDASAPGERVTLILERNGTMIRFLVKDKGTGMDAETLARIGDPFFTTKQPGRGMGLGLFLVRSSAERLGGSLEFQSKVGFGTTAILEIPETGESEAGNA